MFGTKIGWITKMFDYINRVNLTLPLLVYEGTWTHSPPLVAMHVLDRSCVIVGIFLKLHATFSNRAKNDQIYTSHLKGCPCYFLGPLGLAPWVLWSSALT